MKAFVVGVGGGVNGITVSHCGFGYFCNLHQIPKKKNIFRKRQKHVFTGVAGHVKQAPALQTLQPPGLELGLCALSYLCLPQFALAESVRWTDTAGQSFVQSYWL